MVIKKGQIWWVDFGDPIGSEPSYVRPVVIVSGNNFNESKIKTVICAVITSNLKLQVSPGNIFLSNSDSNLPKDSIINITQLVTVDKTELQSYVTQLKNSIIKKIDFSLQMSFELPRY